MGYFHIALTRRVILKLAAIFMFIVAVISIAIIITASRDSNESRNGRIGIQTELQTVQLAVYSMMAKPEVPIISLGGNDARIVGITRCGNDFKNPLALTQDMCDGGLIDICASAECVAKQGTPHPVSAYMSSDKTEHWYCVREDGEVWGYRENCLANAGIDCEEVRIVPPK